jgi:hypothetical protein
MVLWWACTNCGKVVDEFEEQFDSEKRLCSECSGAAILDDYII